MDLSTIDISTAATAILTIIVAIGGVVGKKYVGEALSGLAQVADVLVEVGELIIIITKAGEDEKLSAEEWTGIKEQARDVEKCLLTIQGRFGNVFK